MLIHSVYISVAPIGHGLMRSLYGYFRHYSLRIWQTGGKNDREALPLERYQADITDSRALSQKTTVNSNIARMASGRIRKLCRWINLSTPSQGVSEALHSRVVVAAGLTAHADHQPTAGEHTPIRTGPPAMLLTDFTVIRTGSGIAWVIGGITNPLCGYNPVA